MNTIYSIKHIGVIVDFLVVKVSSTYNAILRRPFLRMFEVIVSTYHLMIKFPTNLGFDKLRGDQSSTTEYYFSSLKGQNKTY